MVVGEVSSVEALDGTGVETGGRLDCVGIATVLNNGFVVDMDTVASGPIVIGTLTIAQSSATAENVTMTDQYGSKVPT